MNITNNEPNIGLQETQTEMQRTIRSRTLNFKENYLNTQIRNRYAFFDKPQNGLSNVILDSYFPKIMYNSGFDEIRIKEITKSFPSTSVAISPWVAETLGVKQMEIEQLCRILGYTKKQIKDLILKVKRLDYTIGFVGYGGTNTNTIHWLSEMANMVSVPYIFKEVIVFEPEDIEISNLFRFPINPFTHNKPSYSDNTNKLKLLSNKELNSISKKNHKVQEYLRYENMYYSSYYDQISKLIQQDYDYDLQEKIIEVKENVVLYGAPGIAFREEAQKYGHFVSATHSGNNCYLHLNPQQDTDIQVESYGVIQLTPFFMNQLRMAIGFLEFLSENPDLTENDKELLSYNFDGTSKLKTDRTYQFNLGHSGLLTTEQEANNAF